MITGDSVDGIVSSTLSQRNRSPSGSMRRMNLARMRTDCCSFSGTGSGASIKSNTSPNIGSGRTVNRSPPRSKVTGSLSMWYARRAASKLRCGMPGPDQTRPLEFGNTLTAAVVELGLAQAIVTATPVFSGALRRAIATVPCGFA